MLSIIGGYESIGRLYRGIISSSLNQYTHLGDASTMTDNLIYKKGEVDPVLKQPLPNDDQWVFTEKNPQRELYVAQVLAAAVRVLKQYNPAIAEKCLIISKELLESNPQYSKYKINTISELFLTTSEPEFAEMILVNVDSICNHLLDYSEIIGRVSNKLNNKEFTEKIEKAVVEYYNKIFSILKQNPYGVPYKPFIWGSGWSIQSFGIKQLYLHLGFPKIIPADYFINSLNFVLGCHPGENTSSFVSGVGVNSLTVAYGANRDEWSYIPGGVASGTALIRPDLPELKIWPYFWQQTEYVMGGGTLDFVLLAMAADNVLNKK